tara:strand:+ start:675 stop:2219 length:1545 start_codon:yes stop_codon:yes gene_type:complete
MEFLTRPSELDDRNGPAYWIDEAIWGHRLHDEQSPWLTFLEFLTVLHGEHRAGRVLVEERLNSLSYQPQLQLRLRNLVFNNPHIMTIRTEGVSDNAAWSEWLTKMAENAGGLSNPDFSYLRDRFNSFSDFVAVLHFIRNSAIEGTSNKRWSSKFVFPFGPNALYEDTNVKPGGSVSNDRRFFARTGELLYLMLTRSSHVNELKPLLVNGFLDCASPHDAIAAALQGETQLAKSERSGSYLPCSSHAAFDRLAEDWLAILRLSIPVHDAIPHLVTLAGLNMLLYQLDRGRELLGNDPISMVCEIVAPKKTVIRDLSADSYQQNNLLPLQAMERMVRRISETPDWQSAITADDPKLSAIEILRRVFLWPEEQDEEDLAEEPAQLIEDLVRRATTRHKQHVGKVHMTWSRAIGLSSRRSSRRVRYAPTDRLLKTLVVACVDERVEFKDFLALLHERYGFIIGDAQARPFINSGAADQEDFSDNAIRLEQRLASLGLLKRLSDSCAYVENPFQRAIST